MVALRRFADADLDAILTIQHSSPEAAQWPAAEWRVFVLPQEEKPVANLRAAYCAWIAHADETPAGFLAALFSGKELEILNLAVPPRMRRQGVASLLLDGALAAAQNSGAERAFLEVRASNVGAIAFYELHQFRLAGRRKSYYQERVEDALVLSRALCSDA
jgi:ribosomal-protein-alanine acetyltransferase